MNAKNEMKKALLAYKTATCNLNNFWDIFEDQHGAGQFRKLYPFPVEFAEITNGVFDWVDDSINTINEMRDVEVTITLNNEQVEALTGTGGLVINVIEELINTRVNYLKGM